MTLATLSFFWKLPRDLNDLSSGLAMVAVNVLQALQRGEKVRQAIVEMNQWSGFEFDQLGTAIYPYITWEGLLALAYAIFGISPSIPMFLSSSIAVLSILAIYGFGKRMCGSIVGYLAALLLATSEGYIVLARTGINFSLVVLSVTLAIWSFYEAYIAEGRQRTRLGVLSGFAIGFCMLGGYPPFQLGIAVLPVWIAFEALSALIRLRLFGESQEGIQWKTTFLSSVRLCAIVAATALLTFLAVTAAWDFIWGAPRGYYIKYLASWRSFEPPPGDFLAMFKKILTTVFVTQPTLFLTHQHSFTLGRPFVHPIVTGLFVVGLLGSVWRNHLTDRLILAWLTVPILIIAARANFMMRWAPAFAPAIYLIAAYGGYWAADTLVDRIKSSQLSQLGQRILLITISACGAVLLVFPIIQTYEYVIFRYGHFSGFIGRYDGLAEVIDFIKHRAPLQNAIIIFFDEHQEIGSYSDLVASIGSGPYGYSTYMKIVNDPSLGPDEISRLRNWEQNQLQQGKVIFYVGTLPGDIPGFFKHLPRTRYFTYYGTPGLDRSIDYTFTAMHLLHPALNPALVTRQPNDIPSLGVWVVDKSVPPSSGIQVKLAPGQRVGLTAKKGARVDRIHIAGPASNSRLTIGDRQVSLPRTLHEREVFTLNFGSISTQEWQPLLESKEVARDLIDSQGVRIVQEGGRAWLEPDENTGSGYLIYQMKAPYPIQRLHVNALPRVYNDVGLINRITGSYSVDGQHYQVFFEVRSNGSERWNWIQPDEAGPDYERHPGEPSVNFFQRETYNVISPKSDVVFIKLSLYQAPRSSMYTNGVRGVQLFSSAGRPMTFLAEFDTARLQPIPIPSKGLIIDYQQDLPTPNSMWFVTSGEGSRVYLPPNVEKKKDSVIPGASLLANGSFEEWADPKQLPDGWQGGHPGLIVRESSVVKTGQYALGLLNVDEKFADFRQDIGNPNQYASIRVSAEAWVWADQPGRAKVCISDRENVFACSRPHSGAGRWERLTISKIVIDKPDFLRFWFQLAAGTNTTAFWDDASLTTGDNTP